MPVVLVVALRLGCLNHTLLTAESIRARGLELAAWVANCVEPDMAAMDANLMTLDTRLTAPRIGVVPYLGDNAGAVAAAAHLDTDVLFR